MRTPQSSLLFSKKHKKSFFGRFNKPRGEWVFLFAKAQMVPGARSPTKKKILAHQSYWASYSTCRLDQRVSLICHSIDPTAQRIPQHQAFSAESVKLTIREHSLPLYLKKKSLALDPARSRTLPCLSVQASTKSLSIRTAPKEVDQYHGSLRSQTRINHGE